MIDRYSLPEMSNIWSLQNQYASWLKVEIAIDEAWSKLGKIPAEDVEKIKKNAKFDVDALPKLRQLPIMISLPSLGTCQNHLALKRNGSTMVLPAPTLLIPLGVFVSSRPTKLFEKILMHLLMSSPNKLRNTRIRS